MKTGKIIKFGEHDWRVLDVQGGKALLISEKILETKQYHKEDEVDITWEFCTLREYLNEDFYHKLGADKTAVAQTLNANPDNPWFGTDGGNATTDKVFLLSLDELVKYFGDSGDLQNKKGYVWDVRSSKHFPKSCGHYLHDRYDTARIAKDADGRARNWWLRSPGKDGSDDFFDRRFAASVNSRGAVEVYGDVVTIDYIGVRPALWLNMET